MERDADWLERVRHGLLVWDRDDLIDWLVWVDPNGIWSDEDMLRDDMDPMSVEDAVDCVMQFVEETHETPEEMMHGSREANPGRYDGRPAFHTMADKGRPST
jgi:hypothetical protein